MRCWSADPARGAKSGTGLVDQALGIDLSHEPTLHVLDVVTHRLALHRLVEALWAHAGLCAGVGDGATLADAQINGAAQLRGDTRGSGRKCCNLCHALKTRTRLLRGKCYMPPKLMKKITSAGVEYAHRAPRFYPAPTCAPPAERGVGRD